MDSKRKISIRDYEEAKASSEIAGFNFSDEDDALFHHMIKLDLDGDERSDMINAYLTGDVQIPDDYLKAEKLRSAQ